MCRITIIIIYIHSPTKIQNYSHKKKIYKFRAATKVLERGPGRISPAAEAAGLALNSEHLPVGSSGGVGSGGVSGGGTNGVCVGGDDNDDG